LEWATVSLRAVAFFITYRMITNTILDSLLPFIGGGVLATILTFWISNKKQNLSEFDVIINRYKEMHDDLIKRVDHLEDEQENLSRSKLYLEKEIIHLRTQLQLFESSTTSLPLPIWIKDLDGKMLYMNDYCINMVLKPLGMKFSDQVGKTDLEIWGKELADQYRKTDERIIRYKKPIESVEPVLTRAGDVYYVDVIKFPRLFEGIVVGVAGVIKGNHKKE